MIRIISIVALMLAGSATTVSAQAVDHDDRQPIVQYVPEGYDVWDLTHEEVHVLLTMISSTEHEHEIRQRVAAYFRERG